MARRVQRWASWGPEQSGAPKSSQQNPQLLHARLCKKKLQIFLAFLSVEELLPDLGNAGCFAADSGQQGPSADCVTRSGRLLHHDSALHPRSPSSLQTGFSAVRVPGPGLIHSSLLPLLLPRSRWLQPRAPRTTGRGVQERGACVIHVALSQPTVHGPE